MPKRRKKRVLPLFLQGRGGHPEVCRMTKSGSAKKTDKVDGRKLRRGRRGRYGRRKVEGADLPERYALLLMAIMEQLEIPEYRHPKSNHVYSYRVKIALLVFRKRLKLSYEQFIIDLPSYPNVLEALGLSESIPDKTTLIRFAKVVDHGDLQAVVCAFQKFVEKDCVVAIDCTGFSNFLRSAHFAKRCKEFGIKKETRTFTKASFAVDTKSHLVLSARVTAGRRHEITFIPEHVKDLEGMLV